MNKQLVQPEQRFINALDRNATTPLLPFKQQRVHTCTTAKGAAEREETIRGPRA